MPRYRKWHECKGFSSNKSTATSRRDTSLSVYSVPTQYFGEVMEKLQTMQELRGWIQTVAREPQHHGEYELWEYKLCVSQKKNQECVSAFLHVYNDKLGNDWPIAQKLGTRPKGALRDTDFEKRRAKGAQRGYRSMVVLSGMSTFGAEVHDFLYSWYAILKRPETETPDSGILAKVAITDRMREYFGDCDRSPPGRDSFPEVSQSKWRPKQDIQQCDAPTAACNSPAAPSLQPLPVGSWQVVSPSVEAQRGIDLNSPKLKKFKAGHVCSQVVESCGVLIRHGKSHVWHLRVPLVGGGWVTLATRLHSTSHIKSAFSNPQVDLDHIFRNAENFDELVAKAQDAWKQFELRQSLLRHSGRNESIADRNESRLVALEKARHVCGSYLASQIHFAEWRSGQGEREDIIEGMRRRVLDLQNGSQFDVSEEMAKLEELKNIVRRRRYAAKKADDQLEFADLEYEDGCIDMNYLNEQKLQTKLEAKAAAKMYREQLAEFRALVNFHSPEELHRIAKCDLDFINIEIEKASPSLRAQISRIFDVQRDITDYDDDLKHMRTISSHDASHIVYETTLDGKRCVLKRINLCSKDGLARLIKEIKYMVKLAHRDLTVPIQCAFRGNEWGYLQFERYDYDLMQWMTLQKPSPRNKSIALRIIRRMIQAVTWVHSQNVVHGDLKPANFLLDKESGLPRLHDFETAMECHDEVGIVNASKSWTTIARGTPRYEAPEVKANRDYPRSKSTDVFALGICIQDVLESLLPRSGCEELKKLAARLTCNSSSERLITEEIESYFEDEFQEIEQESFDQLSVEMAQGRCQDLFHTDAYVEAIVKSSEIRFTQDACSSCFSDGSPLDELIDAIVNDPSFPLQHNSLILDVVVFRDKRTRPPRTYLHSVDNRRLYCFQEAQRRLEASVSVRIRKYDFGPTFHSFLGHFDTRTQGKSIKLRQSYDDVRSGPSSKKSRAPPRQDHL